MGAVVDSRGTTRTWSRDWSNVCATWIHSTETPVRHTESSEMWPGQMRRISPPMGRDRITCLPLRREPPDHKAHCWRVPTHYIPWRPATSTPSGSCCSGMVVETVIETVRVFQTNNNNNRKKTPGGCIERLAWSGSCRESVRGVVGTMNTAWARPDWLATVHSGRKQAQSRVCTPGFRQRMWNWPSLRMCRRYRPLSRRLDRCDRVIQNEGDDSIGGNV